MRAVGVARRVLDRIALRRGALHERRIQDRWLRSTGRFDVDRAFVARHGARVLGGPFAGMAYPPSAAGRVHHLVAKLLGAYERELAAVVAEQLARRPPLFVDVGAADGYYAVGFAVASPSTRVHAFEVDPVAKRALRALARLNGAADRVVVHGPANPWRLASLDLHGAFVLCDCEGAELDVLAGEAVPALAGATVLVEVHPLGDGEGHGDTGPPLRERFEASHTVRAFEPEGRDPDEYPELEGLPGAEDAIDEARFGRTSWLLFEPRREAHPPGRGEPHTPSE